MRHLFIINPKAQNLPGKPEEVADDIRAFFSNYPDAEAEIHITRWKRDALGITERLVSTAKEIVRVYVFGGDGTVFEAVNGIAGFPNAQLAWYPCGRDNSLLHAFGEGKFKLFRSLRRLVSSPVKSIDTLKAGNNYGISNIIIGIEAQAYVGGSALADKTRLPRNMAYMAAGALMAARGKSAQNYHIDIDGKILDGKYISVLVTNSPTYGSGMRPGAEAVIDDGYLDLYLVKDLPFRFLFRVIGDYMKGDYKKWPAYLSHHRGKTVAISSDSVITLGIDGEIFYTSLFKAEIAPQSVDFVFPQEVDIHYKPARGGVGEILV